MAVKRALVISGGSAKFWYGIGVVHELFLQGNHYDIVIGTSAGAICSAMVGTGQHMKGYNLAQQFTPEKLFHVPNRFMTGWKLFRGQSVIDRRPFEKYLKELFPPEAFMSYIESYAVSYNLTEDAIQTFRLGQVDGDTVTVQPYQAIMASTSIPVIFSPVAINLDNGRTNDLFVDGGVVSNYPIKVALERGAQDITVVSMTEPIIHNTDDLPTNYKHHVAVAERCLSASLLTQLRNDLKLCKALNDKPGYEQLSVRLVQPSRKLNLGLTTFTPQDAKIAIDIGRYDAHHNMREIV